MTAPLPDALEIVPLERPPSASVQVPGSKSITNRALVLAALCSGAGEKGEIDLWDCLRSEDTEVMIAADRITIADIVPEKSYTITSHAKSTAGFVEGVGRVELEGNGDGSTLVRFSGEAKVGGSAHVARADDADPARALAGLPDHLGGGCAHLDRR